MVLSHTLSFSYNVGPRTSFSHSLSVSVSLSLSLISVHFFHIGHGPNILQTRYKRGSIIILSSVPTYTKLNNSKTTSPKGGHRLGQGNNFDQKLIVHLSE